MSNNAQMISKQRKRRFILDRIYDVLDVGVEERSVSSAMFEDRGRNISTHTVGDYVRDFDSIGILKRRFEYGTPNDSMGLGRHYHWTLLVDHDTAVAKLAELDRTELATMRANTSAATKKRFAKPKPVEHSNGKDETVAIVGPDAPMSFDVLRPYRRIVSEPYALVEAARQYRDRTKTMNATINGLLDKAKELGVAIDETALRGSVVYEATDPRLDAISLVLPYIEQLEAATARLLGQVEGLKEQVAELNKARMEITSLRAQNERLIAKQVAH